MIQDICSNTTYTFFFFLNIPHKHTKIRSGVRRQCEKCLNILPCLHLRDDESGILGPVAPAETWNEAEEGKERRKGVKRTAFNIL